MFPSADILSAILCYLIADRQKSPYVQKQINVARRDVGVVRWIVIHNLATFFEEGTQKLLPFTAPVLRFFI